MLDKRIKLSNVPTTILVKQPSVYVLVNVRVKIGQDKIYYYNRSKALFIWICEALRIIYGITFSEFPPFQKVLDFSTGNSQGAT